MTFSNPVIAGFHPDPSVCRVGTDHYLATSTFTYAPGVAIFRSSNLVDWTQIGSALDRPSLLDLRDTTVHASFGVFAPTLRHHDGRFWMITTVFSATGPDSYLVTATDPAGPWSEPVRVPVGGIDPDLAWGPDGTCWVHYANGQRIERVAIDPATGEVLDGPDPTWSGTGLQYPEAPHLFERDGTWYLLIAEGGTERGHSVSVARGPSPTGPWEGAPDNPILSHRSTDRPIQNTGHADLVEALDGSWWMVLLGTRPRGGSPMWHVLGRETFLAPVRWVDGWPRLDPVATSVDAVPPGPIPEQRETTDRDDFDGPRLDPRWLAVRAFPSEVASLDVRPGWLTVHGGSATLDAPFPAFVGRRQQHHRFRARALVDAGDATQAGLCLRMDEHHHYEVAVEGDSIVARARIGPLATVVARVARPDGPTVVSIETTPATLVPDVVRLGYLDADGATVTLAKLDGRYLSTEVAGGMVGRVVGLYAVGGDAAFDWFEYHAGATDG